MNTSTNNIPQCAHQLSAIHIYGTYKNQMNKVALCDECGRDLWMRIKDSVAAQHMHYEIMPVKGTT